VENSLTVNSNEKFSLINELYEWAEAIVFPLAGVILVFSLIFRIMGVSGVSMENTLNQGVTVETQTQDRVIISDFNYTPKCGDIVAISKKIGSINLIVKRIIAVGGETVNIDSKRHIVYVNGKALKEPYINNPTSLEQGMISFPITVPKNSVFVMGDNRGDSYDGRYFGCVSKHDIIGKVYFRILPLSRFGPLK
jgi:signal peptidase I